MAGVGGERKLAEDACGPRDALGRQDNDVVHSLVVDSAPAPEVVDAQAAEDERGQHNSYHQRYFSRCPSHPFCPQQISFSSILSL